MAEFIDRDEYKKVLMGYLKSHHVMTDTWVSEGMRIAIQGCCELLDNEPAADVVEKEKYNRMLKIAKKMHIWIFLNTADEQAAYDECGLTDEDNALIGYVGKIELHVREKENG